MKLLFLLLAALIEGNQFKPRKNELVTQRPWMAVRVETVRQPLSDIRRKPEFYIAPPKTLQRKSWARIQETRGEASLETKSLQRPPLTRRCIEAY